jgi:hypothetical protein
MMHDVGKNIGSMIASMAVLVMIFGHMQTCGYSYLVL